MPRVTLVKPEMDSAPKAGPKREITPKIIVLMSEMGFASQS